MRFTSSTRPAARIALLLTALLALWLALSAQSFGRRSRPNPYGPIDRGNVPTWPLDEPFAHDVFTFARLQYASSGRERTSFAWWTDYPSADLDLSFRLQQLTSLKVHPDPKVVPIVQAELAQYPWIIMSGVGNILLTHDEALTLRRYLLNGGFILVDDFWGQNEWDGFYRALKQIFPDREPRDLPRSHPVFHAVYDLPNDRSLQTPNVRSAIAGRETGVTWEDNHAGGNTREPHFRGVSDDHGRLMMLICHNTDNGDGWEEEGTDAWFFHTFSENKNYPLAINILYYVMTH